MNPNTIIEEGIPKDTLFVPRKTVRAIITDSKRRVIMAYSRFFDDYTFPGGGIKEHETPEAALRRELDEELGAFDVHIIAVFMTTKELKHSIRGDDTIFMQESTFYWCSVGGFGQPNPGHREQCHGLEAVRITPEQALEHNMSVMHDIKHSKPGMRTVLKRENIVLEALIREASHESI